MRVTMNPAPSPFKDVDPRDVVVTKITRAILDGRHEAWGYLRSEMQLVSFDITADRMRIINPTHEPGPTYRIAYEDCMGNWQAEGTTHREPPHDLVLRQITEILGLIATGKSYMETS